MKKIAGFLLFLFTVIISGAQERTARIYHAEGADFSVMLRSERTVFSAGSVFREGISLGYSGVVQTGTGTLLEIQLIPSGTLIKLSENTSLCYNGYDENGGFDDFGLLYGSIRVVTGNSITRMNSVVIRGGGVSVRLDEGDLGVDYVIEPGARNSSPRPLFRVYPFRGGAVVFPYGRDGAIAYFGGAQSLAVGVRESLSVDVTSPFTYAEKKVLGREVQDYWRNNNFKGSSPLSMPDTGIAAEITEQAPPLFTSIDNCAPVPGVMANEAPVDIIRTVPEQYVITRNRTKNLALAIGLSLIVGSVGVQMIASQFDTAANSSAKNLYDGAYATLGLGIATSTAGILFNPLASRR